MRGDDREQTCFIPWSDGVVKKDELKAFDGLARFMQPMIESTGGGGSERGQWAREMPMFGQ